MADIDLACPYCFHDDALCTVESLLANAYTYRIVRRDDGSVVPEYAGESEVIWDTQDWDGQEVLCKSCGNTMATADLIPKERQ